MEVKEAIEFLEIEENEFNPNYAFNKKVWLERERKFKEIIELLQRGEKYEAMWEELEKEKCILIDFDDEGYYKGDHRLKDIKQKYFPKKEVTDEKG